MVKIDKNLEKRVNEKRKLFIAKIKEFGLAKSAMDEIKALSQSMERANALGEKELALHYKNQIKKVITKNR